MAAAPVSLGPWGNPNRFSPTWILFMTQPHTGPAAGFQPFSRRLPPHGGPCYRSGMSPRFPCLVLCAAAAASAQTAAFPTLFDAALECEDIDLRAGRAASSAGASIEFNLDDARHDFAYGLNTLVTPMRDLRIYVDYRLSADDGARVCHTFDFLDRLDPPDDTLCVDAAPLWRDCTLRFTHAVSGPGADLRSTCTLTLPD